MDRIRSRAQRRARGEYRAFEHVRPGICYLTLPDKGAGIHDFQSVFFREYLEVLAGAVDGKDCVLSGCLVSAQGTPDMTVAVAKGAVLSNGSLFAVAAGNVNVTAADATNPRIDLIVVNSAGAKAIRTGAAAAAPKPPARNSNDVVLAAIYVPAGDTAINANQITDLRPLRTRGPITIYKTTVAETTNTTAAAIEALNKAASGVTLPSGLFLAGKILRVRMGGNLLLNSGTPTVRIEILYGGTVMFSDISAASAASAVRRGWNLTFDIAAQGNADQALVGFLDIAAIAGITAPTTGIGDVWAHTHTAGSFAGSAAADSDAADRVLSVRITLSVSNAANELVVESASVELV